MERFKNYIINTIYGFGFTYAFFSSIYCLNLIFKHFIDPKDDYMFISFIICIAIFGFMIDKHNNDIEKIKKETTDTIFRIYKIKGKEEK